MEVDIKTVRRLCQVDAVRWTNHVAQRLIKRDISPDEVMEVLLCGDIIEHYPYPSCLLYAMVHNGRPLHVVCSVGAGQIFVITAYEPDKDRWDETFTRRKKEEV